jgi:hypothetical protein
MRYQIDLNASQAAATRKSEDRTGMRLKFLLFFTLALCFCNNQLAAQSPNPCVLPSDLQGEIAKKYPDAHFVTLADLDEYRRKLFRKDHGSACPGLVKVDFYGDRKPTFAIVLVSGENPNRKAQLVVARQVDGSWQTRLLDTTDGTPVVWRDHPGKYEGMSEPNTIRAKNPVIVFCGLESWAIVYAWNGKDVEKLQVSD